MVPLRLRLRNFMCYRDNVPLLELEGIHVACLSGENGHGKSALLDAMTWALWGQARAKTDDELIHLGQSEMEVELEFLVGQDRYRVVRKRSKAGSVRPSHRGDSALELHLAGPEGFVPITGNTIRETERKINTILRMDYQTFVNSALLLQGRADEFTLRTPAERKEVLAEILGLGYYDALEARAKERRDAAREERLRWEQELRNIDEELVSRDEFEVEYSTAARQVQELEAQEKLREASASALRERQRLLEFQAQQLVEVQARIREQEAEIEELERQAAEHRHQIQLATELLAQSEDIRAGYRRLVEAREENERWTIALVALGPLTQEKHRLERALEAARAELEAQFRVLQSQTAQLQERLDAIPRLTRELVQAQTSLAAVQEQETHLAQRRAEAQQRSSAVQLLASQRKQLEAEGKELAAKLDLLARGDARCPLCGTELDSHSRQEIEAHYQQEIQQKRERYRQQEDALVSEQKAVAALQQAVEEMERRVGQERAVSQSRVAALEHALSEAQAAQQGLGRLRPELLGGQERLAQEAFGQEDRAALRVLEERIVALNYDPLAHQAVQERVRELEPFEARWRELEGAARDLSQGQGALDRVEEGVRRGQARLEEEARRRAELERELVQRELLLGQAAEAERNLQQTRVRLGEARQDLGIAQAKLERLRALAEARRERARLLDKAREEEGIYQELAEAFGKRGVQALLIEQALPELEEEASRLLARMTDHRMSLKLESQRETRAGNVIETLDIKTADELGTRNYELFSGGEAFRINFALRIALSKLLARRAGAPLPTLIIDEGFGTQDAAGREKLVEAIIAIQDDFQRILVVTHIEELKDAFPVRIEVTKGPDGSTFTVS